MAKLDLQREVDDPDSGSEMGDIPNLEHSILASAAIQSQGRRALPEPEESTALFMDGYEGYFDQHKQREKISATPFTKAPAIDGNELITLNQRVPASLPALQEKLRLQYRSLFSQWALEIDQGFNLLFYGIGSKRQFIMDFVDFWDPSAAVVVVNGYNPATTFKEVLNTCVSCLVDEEEYSEWLRQPSERLLLFLDFLEKAKTRLVLVVHSIDGSALRDDKTRSMLVRLVASPYVSLVASVDHVNSPLLWTSEQASQLNFAWHDVTNYELYLTEVGYTDVMSLGKSRAAVNAKGVKYVLESLTQNARSLYLVLITAQYERMVEQGCGPNTSGTSAYAIVLQQLYQQCVEQLVVSAEMNFKLMLAEFIEHKMVEKTKSKDGQELVFVPYSLDDLEHMIEDLS